VSNKVYHVQQDSRSLGHVNGVHLTLTNQPEYFQELFNL